MPNKPKRLCPKCGAIIADRCAACAKRYDAQPDRKADKAFYSSQRWRKFRQYMLNLEPMCRQCKTAVAVHLHHEQPRKTHEHLAFDENNVTPLCLSCHSRIEATRHL